MDNANKIFALIEDKFYKDRFWVNLYISFAKRMINHCKEAGESYSAFRRFLPAWLSAQDSITQKNAVGLLSFANSSSWPSDN